MAQMMISQRRRNDFMQSYAQQRGWDPSHLTVAQMQEMAQSDEFKSLGHTDE